MAAPGVSGGRTVDELLAAAEERTAALQRAAAAHAAVREVGRSDGDEVHALVDADGALVDLWLAPGTTGLPGSRLGALVVQACARAADLAEQRARTIAARAGGDAVAAEWDRLRGPSPAAAAGWDPVGDRLRAHPPADAPPAPEQPDDADPEAAGFDFTTLRSDRG